jgi:hypothetical protein
LGEGHAYGGAAEALLHVRAVGTTRGEAPHVLLPCVDVLLRMCVCQCVLVPCTNYPNNVHMV